MGFAAAVIACDTCAAGPAAVQSSSNGTCMLDDSSHAQRLRMLGPTTTAAVQIATAWTCISPANLPIDMALQQLQDPTSLTCYMLPETMAAVWTARRPSSPCRSPVCNTCSDTRQSTCALDYSSDAQRLSLLRPAIVANVTGCANLKASCVQEQLASTTAAGRMPPTWPVGPSLQPVWAQEASLAITYVITGLGLLLGVRFAACVLPVDVIRRNWSSEKIAAKVLQVKLAVALHVCRMCKDKDTEATILGLQEKFSEAAVEHATAIERDQHQETVMDGLADRLERQGTVLSEMEEYITAISAAGRVMTQLELEEFAALVDHAKAQSPLRDTGTASGEHAYSRRLLHFVCRTPLPCDGCRMLRLVACCW
ncbi:hypothetical protein COO60DRAFT_1655004 [Scenedesmus sp. NREL 46B-D3]|nr:hypothetical protein COO60DRAFT_1655004 [Scenedesmus sp. NREL 46B-D3]